MVVLLISSFNLFAQDKLQVLKIDNVPVEKIYFKTDSTDKVLELTLDQKRTIYEVEIKSLELKKGKSSLTIKQTPQEIIQSLKRVGGDGTGGGITLDPETIKSIESTGTGSGGLYRSILKRVGGDGTGGG